VLFYKKERFFQEQIFDKGYFGCGGISFGVESRLKPG